MLLRISFWLRKNNSIVLGLQKNSSGSWGERANRDLKFTQGKSFQREKTKKKRGNYSGGLIDQSVNSVKFDD